MKNKIMKSSFVCFLLFMLFTCLCFSSCNTTGDLIFSGKDYTEEYITEDEDYLTTNITYPKFINNPELNKIIKNTVESNWERFKTYSEKEWYEISNLNSSRLMAPFQYMVSYNVTYSGDIVSVFLSTYNYNGGAHGNTSITTYNYDRRKKEFLNITEASGYSYEELSDICNKDLYKQFIESEKFDLNQDAVENLDNMRREGTAPIAGNFQNFILDGNKVIIYFEPYSVAPYSYGIPEVEFYKK